MENKHVASIPEAVKNKAQTDVNAIKEGLEPYAKPLTPEERHTLPKMGDRNSILVEKAFGYATANPKFVPPYLDMDAFATDKEDALGLRVLHNSVRQLEEYIADIETLAGSEAYQAALLFYGYVKGLAAQDVPGAKAVYEELKTFFHKTRPKKQA
jgi:hypothetical protein